MSRITQVGSSIVTIVLATLLISVGCGRKKTHPAPQGPVPLAKMKAFGNEIYPLANGDAYLLNQYNEQLYYLSRGAGRRVEGVELRGLDPTIFPLANGAAYLASSDHSNLRLYYLIEDRAIEVKEAEKSSSTLSPDSPSREGFLWAQAQATNTRFRRYKSTVEDQQQADEPERDDY